MVCSKVNFFLQVANFLLFSENVIRKDFLSRGNLRLNKNGENVANDETD